jgi:hypothetical protein
MKKIITALMFICIFCANGGVQAGVARVAQADRQETGGDLELVARFDFTNPLSMVASGDLVFVGMQVDQNNQVAILDATDPAHPVEVAAIDLGEHEFYPLGVIGEMLYISVREEGIRLYDISTPAAPLLVKTFYPLEYLFPWQMVVSGSLAYLADLNGLVILDITDPANPALVGNQTYPASIFSLAVQGNYVYGLGGGALIAYDVANPAQPLFLSEYYVSDPTRSGPVTLAVKGSFAYLSGIVYNSEMPESYAELIDISDPTNLRTLGDLPALAARNNQTVVAGDLLYAARNDGLAIFDLIDPADPQPLGAYPGYFGLAVQPQAGRTVYLDQVTGLQLLDTSDPASPQLLGFYNWPQRSSNIEVVGTNLYSVQGQDYDYLLQVVDISDPHSPRVSGQAMIDAYPGGRLFVAGTTVYLPTMNGLIIVETANLDSIQTAKLDGGVFAVVVVKQDTAYAITAFEGGFYIIDVTDPLTPSVLEKLILGEGSSLSVAEQGDMTVAYIQTSSGWWAVDVSNPAAPRVVYHDGSEVQRITTETQGDKTILYLAKSEGLAAIDVSDPTNPLDVGFYPMEMGGATVLMVEDAMVYFAGDSDGDLKLIDFSDPANPALLAHAAAEGAFIYDASLTQEYIIAAASENGDIYFFAKRVPLEGRVTDHNYQPFPGVSLALSNGDASLSDAEGNYTFPNLEFGSYAITPTLAGFAFTPTYRLATLPQDWRGQDFVILPAPVSIALQPGITTTLTYTDVQGLPTSFAFPVGLVDAPATAVVTPTLADSFFGMDFAGHAFELAIQGEALEPIYSQPVTVTIHYSELDTAVISDTTQLALYRWGEGGWVEASASCPSQPIPVTPEPGVFQAAICQDGRYALLGPTRSVAIPVLPEG